MTTPTDKDAIIKRLEAKNAYLQKRVDAQAEEIESLTLELQARAHAHTEEARRRSWGGNGRY